MKRVLVLAAACAFLGMTAPARSSGLDYLDDRSTPQALIQSLYNAISRGEYARAYAYFGTPPAETSEAYAERYFDTDRMEVTTGVPRADEHPDESITYYLPVAARALTADGDAYVYTGCYAIRFAPTVPEPAFRPLFIEGERLEPADAPGGQWRDALPPSCGEGDPITADPLLLITADPLLRQAEQLFDAVFDDVCPADEMGIEEEPESYPIRLGQGEDSADTPQSEARLFRFFCGRGAYNAAHVYILADDRGGLTPVNFATPQLDIRRENDDWEGRVEEVRIVGYRTESLLVGSWFHPEDQTISSHGKWRGVGDASSGGTWVFRSGAFSLVRYEVDASYDGELNPETVLDYSSDP